MPAEDGAAEKASYSDIEFVGSEKDKSEDFVKVKTAVRGNLYSSFYAIDECERYRSIDSKDLLELIEKHSGEYKLLDHIEKIKKAFDNYKQQSFYGGVNATEEEVRQKSYYAEQFKALGLFLDIYELDKIKDNFLQNLNNFDKTQEDWFDKLRRDNKHLYHIIVGSYLATNYKQFNFDNKHEGDGDEKVNNFLPHQLTAYAEFLFPKCNIVTSLEEVQFEIPSPSPTPQNTEKESQNEAEKINNELLEKLKESKKGDDQEAKNKAQEEFNFPPDIYSGLGLKVELVGDPPSENHQGEFEYKYKIIGGIKGGLASTFYDYYKDKNLHIVFKCKPEEHDQVITDIRNLKRIKGDTTKNTESLFQIWSGIDGGSNTIVGGKSKLDSNDQSVNMLYGPPNKVKDGEIKGLFYTKSKETGAYEAKNYDEFKKICDKKNGVQIELARKNVERQ